MYSKLQYLSLILLLSVPDCLSDCPNKTFICPTGERITVGTCYNWYDANCYPCRNMEEELRMRCRKYSCGGSVENWYGRSDGCSSPVFSVSLTIKYGFACRVHDICYATPGRSRLDCDNEFYSNMKTTCGMAGIGIMGYPGCIMTAAIMYRAVRNHGGNFPGFARTCTEV